jgi:integrase
MPRRSTGGVRIDTRRKEPVFELRFRANGQRRFQRLGTPAEGWTREKAEAALRHVLADVERRIWQPPIPEPVEETREVPSFHRFATDWLERAVVEGGRRGGGLTANGKEDLEWRLSNHLLKAFASKRVDAITIEDVDRFRLTKVKEGKLSPSSVNKLLSTLAAILEDAVEYELIDRNPAKGKRRRLAAAPVRRSYLDRADHIAALLDGASKVDEAAIVRQGQRRALMATLIFAGLRIGEALSLRWQDVDLARGTITVRQAKTDAGQRTVYIVPILRDELTEYRAGIEPAQTALVFGTSTGRRQGATNIRLRVLAKAVEHANKQLVKQRLEPLPEGLTPHALRRTFASLLFAVGESPPYVMGQMGHTTANLTLAIYARQMDRRDGEPERLKALVEGREWVATGSSSEIHDKHTPVKAGANGSKPPVNSGYKGP